MKFARAVQFYSQGSLDQAESLCRSIAKAHPRNFEASHLLGVIALQRGKPQEADRQIRRAIQIAPDVAMAHNSLGIVLKELNRLEEALESFNRALALEPNYVEALGNLGAVQHALKRFKQAVATYDRAIALQPDFAGGLANRGNSLMDLERYEEALASVDRALALQPHYPEALNTRGRALSGLKRYKEAISSFDRALALRPAYVAAYLNRGNTLTELQRPEAALADFEKAIALKPDMADAFSAHGLGLHHLGRVEEAIESFDRAIALNPDYAAARNNRAQALLAAGRLAEGWRDAEERWNMKDFKSPKPDISAPEWSGESLNGRPILVYAEQGYGDMIQFSRYLPLLVAQGPDVTFLAPPQLERLLSSVSSKIKITSTIDRAARFDAKCALMTLPLHFNTELATIPASVPYLTTELDKVAFWKDRIGPDGFKIGICWQANRAVMQGRSFPVRALQPLAQMDGVRLISLQKGYGVEQLDELPAGMAVETLGENFDEGPDAFIDTAAAMQSLDLVITCDTSIAHLAGALARPAWVALKFVPDWRWLFNRSDSPWYPTLRLYRQAAPDDWAPVFRSIAEDLARLVRRTPAST
jgi:tetratricopeptide (TPR) repeat protein